MKLIFKYFLLLLFVGTATALFAQKEQVRRVNKEFQVAPDVRVNLQSEYGSLAVTSWDKPYVKVEVEVVVRATSEKLAEETLEKIFVDISGNSQEVKMVTEVRGNIYAKGNIIRTGGGSKVDDFSINSKVYAPAQANIILRHKFGEAMVGDFSGNVDVAVEHGQLGLGEMKGKLTAAISFGRMNVVSAGNCALKVNYSDADFGSVGAINMEVNFGNISLDEIDGNFDATINHSNVKIENIGDKFREARLVANFSSVKLEFQQDMVVKVSASMTNSNLRYNTKVTDVIEKKESGLNSQYKLILGSGENPESKLDIVANNGNVNLVLE